MTDAPYTNFSASLDCTKVIVDTSDPEFVAFRFYQTDPKRHWIDWVVHTVFVSTTSGTKNYFNFHNAIEAHDKYILMEQVNAENNPSE